jgi:hypothetical protein
MKVADLQQHLLDLRRLLDAAGGSKTVVNDLDAIQRGLQPFRDAALKDFADFLVRAETYRAGGEVPLKQPPAKKTKEPKSVTPKVKAPAPDADALAREVRQLYDQAASAAVTQELIEEAMGRVGKLTKPGLLVVAAGIELKMGSSTAKDKVIAAIRQRLVDRKGSYQRAGLLDRETGAPPDGHSAAADRLVGAGASPG